MGISDISINNAKPTDFSQIIKRLKDKFRWRRSSI